MNLRLLRALAWLMCLAATGLGVGVTHGQPILTSWQTYSGARYARLYTNQTAALAGNSVTTWIPGGRVVNGSQPNPVYAGVQSVRVSTNWVYVQSSALPGYVMGPWYLDAAKTQLFPNWPVNQNMLTRFPRVPTNSTAHTLTSLGAIALWVDAEIIHNQLDAYYWNGRSDTNAGLVFTNSWWRNADAAELLTFDPTGSHQPHTGERHFHISPSALRYQLGDHLDYHPATLTYAENPALTNHSPILGWAFDGYPIYGPYGYAVATNAHSAVRRLISGYVPRDGNYGTTNLNATGRASYPAWALAIGETMNLTGPAVSTAYPLGWYVQDFDYLGDHGYAQGTDFDLDRYNGRFCVTPDFPGGTYAYFTTVDSNGVPAFPYVIGPQYYGVKTGGDYGATATVGFTNVETPNVTNYLGGPNAALLLQSPQPAGGTVTLTWSSAEGGHYNAEVSTNLTAWTTNAVNVSAVNLLTNSVTSQTSLATNLFGGSSRVFFRVVQTSLDTYAPVTAAPPPASQGD